MAIASDFWQCVWIPLSEFLTVTCKSEDISVKVASNCNCCAVLMTGTFIFLDLFYAKYEGQMGYLLEMKGNLGDLLSSQDHVGFYTWVGEVMFHRKGLDRHMGNTRSTEKEVWFYCCIEGLFTSDFTNAE